MTDGRMERVADLMREVAAQEILPRFRALSEGDIEEKSKGDFVTIADRDAELWLTPRLEALVPGSRVLGEEATAKTPDLLSIVESAEAYWTVDPVDGTGNFVAGRETFGVMIAFVEGGDVRQAWIYLPVSGDMAMAELGAGAYWHSSGQASRMNAFTARSMSALCPRHGATASSCLPILCRANLPTSVRHGTTQNLLVGGRTL
mgnify:CR=1 FL=1